MSMVGYSPWGHKELNMTEWLSMHTMKLGAIVKIWIWYEKISHNTLQILKSYQKASPDLEKYRIMFINEVPGCNMFGYIFGCIFWPLFHLVKISYYFCCCCSIADVSSSVTPWTAAHQPSLSFTVSRDLFRLMSIELVIHPIFSSSVGPFFSGPQSFPTWESFPVSWLFTSGGSVFPWTWLFYYLIVLQSFLSFLTQFWRCCVKFLDQC